MQAIYETGKQLIRLINSHNDIIVSSHCVVSAVKIQAIIFMLFHYVLSASLTLSLAFYVKHCWYASYKYVKPWRGDSSGVELLWQALYIRMSRVCAG